MDLFKTTEISKPSRVMAYTAGQAKQAVQREDYCAVVQSMFRADFGKEVINQRATMGRGAKINRVIQSIAGFVQSDAFLKVVEGDAPPRQGHLWDLFVRQLLLNEWEIGVDCWVVPNKNKFYHEDKKKWAEHTTWRVSLRPEFWLRLCLQDPNIARVQLGVVYEGDEFDLNLGSDPYLHHKPQVEVDDNSRVAICAYAVLWGKKDTKNPMVIEYLNKRQIRERKEKSSTANKTDEKGRPVKSPWNTDEEAMLRAKAAGLLRKYITAEIGIPISEEMAAKMEKAARAQGLVDITSITDISDMEEVEEVMDNPAMLENNAPAPMEVAAPTVSKKETVPTNLQDYHTKLHSFLVDS